MQITMGKVDGKRFAVDTEALRRSHLLITGVSGSGKSYRLRVLAESLFPVMPVFLFDVEGEFYTLREKFAFMLFGEGGDAPMAVETAALTARKLMEWKKSAIFDLSSLEVDAQHEWMREFLSSLLTAPRELWGPVACLIDESHLWMPEKGEGVSVALNAAKNLCSRGRKRGFFVVLATQRLSKLANNCASEMQNYLVGRTTLPADRDRAAKMLGVTAKADKDAFFRDIKTLKDHYFFAQGIALSPDRIKVAPIEAETTHIRPGDIQEVMPAAPAEIQAFLPQLSTLAKEAKEQLHTTEDLQRRVHELTAELAAARSGKPAESPAIRAELASEKEKRIAAERLLGTVGSGFAHIADLAQKLRDTALQSNQADIKPESLRAPDTVGPLDPRRNLHISEPGDYVIDSAKASSNGHGQAEIVEEIGDTPAEKAQRKLLGALRSAELVRIPGLSRTWLAIVARVSPSSSSYRRNVSALEQPGLVHFPTPGDVALTDAGRAQTMVVTAPLTTASLLDALHKVFEPARYRILLALVEASGEWMSREELAAAVGQSPTSSAYRGHLSELRQLGLVEIGANSTVRIDPFIFLRGAVLA